MYKHRQLTQAKCVAPFFLGTLRVLQRNCLRLAKYVLIANRLKTKKLSVLRDFIFRLYVI